MRMKIYLFGLLVCLSGCPGQPEGAIEENLPDIIEKSKISEADVPKSAPEPEDVFQELTMPAPEARPPQNEKDPNAAIKRLSDVRSEIQELTESLIGLESLELFLRRYQANTKCDEGSGYQKYCSALNQMTNASDKHFFMLFTFNQLKCKHDLQVIRLVHLQREWNGLTPTIERSPYLASLEERIQSNLHSKTLTEVEKNIEKIYLEGLLRRYKFQADG